VCVVTNGQAMGKQDSLKNVPCTMAFVCTPLHILLHSCNLALHLFNPVTEVIVAWDALAWRWMRLRSGRSERLKNYQRARPTVQHSGVQVTVGAGSRPRAPWRGWSGMSLRVTYSELLGRRSSNWLRCSAALSA